MRRLVPMGWVSKTAVRFKACFMMTVVEGSFGDGNFSHGELAPVEAVPAKGYAFAGWSGLGITNSNALVTTVLMDQNRSLTATFSPSSKPLTVYHGIGGSTTGEGNFSYNSEATVEATPDEGYEFSTWTGEGIKEPNLQTTTVPMNLEEHLLPSAKKYNLMQVLLQWMPSFHEKNCLLRMRCLLNYLIR